MNFRKHCLLLIISAVLLSGHGLVNASAAAATDPAAEIQPAKTESQDAVTASPPLSTDKPAAGYLQGRVTASPSPLLYGSVQSLPAGTKVDLSLSGNLNSEINQKGDEIFARVCVDVKEGEKVLLPGGWFLHGLVTDVASQRRLGRDGYVEVEFDKLLSPDGQIELPFSAKVSTRDNKLKAVAKTLAIDSGYVTAGALAGALLSVQFTGLPVAIMSHGYSVAIGAGVGATLGAIGALKRKGKIASFYPGDEMKLTVFEPIILPGFDPTALPSASKSGPIKDLELSINKARFSKDPYDSASRLLTLDLLMKNDTKDEYSFFDLAIVSDRNQRYYPSVLGDFRLWKQKVKPNCSQQATMTFSVDSPKRKYWLVLLDRRNRQELTRVPIN